MIHVQRLAAPPRITRTPDIMGGMPCIEGTRVPAEAVLACHVGGDTDAEIYECYPRIPFGSIELVVEWARLNGRAVPLFDRRVSVADAGGPGERPGF